MMVMRYVYDVDGIPNGMCGEDDSVCLPVAHEFIDACQCEKLFLLAFQFCNFECQQSLQTKVLYHMIETPTIKHYHNRVM